MGALGAVGGWFEDWWNGGQGRGKGNRPGEDPIWRQIDSWRDSYGQLVGIGRIHTPTKMLLGESRGSLRLTDPQTSILALGPARRGKTAGLLIPNLLLAPGPAVSTSSKPDMAIATAMARRRIGDVWHFSPTDPCPRGFLELRWSPVVGAEDYDRALVMGRRLIRVSAMESESAATEANHRFFTEEASLLLAALLHYAAIQGLDIEFVVEALAMRSHTEMQRHVATLSSKGSTRAAKDLAGLMNSADRQRSGVFATAAVGLRAYEHSGAMKAAKEPNFDPVKFVAGRPLDNCDLHCEPESNQAWQVLSTAGFYPWVRGRYDTVYITTGDAEDMTAPLIVTLIGEIRRAAYAQARQDDFAGYFDRAPTTLVLDELFATPLPDLPQLLAEGASRGCLMIGGLQAPAQAVARWGQAGIVPLVMAEPRHFSGLRDDDIHLLSSIGGEFDREVWTGSESGRQWNRAQHWDRMRNLPPDVIARGDPSDADKVLVFLPDGSYDWIRVLPYYRGRLWPPILAQSSEWALRSGLHLQPLPDLNRTRDYRHLRATGGEGLVNWWKEVEFNYGRMNGHGADGTAPHPNAA